MTMILEKILTYKKDELDHYKRQVRLEELKAKAKDASRPRSLKDELKNSSQPFAIIAEIKRKSPSKGLLRDPFDPVAIAHDYAEHGAIAISVLTDEHFFGGHLDHLKNVRRAVSLPLLRKDFIWDPYQIYSAVDAGADAILLIVAMLEQNQMMDLKGLAEELGLSVLVEVHDAKECAIASGVNAALVGINNRDLRTFKVELSTTERLLPLLSADVIKVSESGIEKKEHLEALRKIGVHGFLIGEAFMKAKSPGKALQSLIR